MVVRQECCSCSSSEVLLVHEQTVCLSSVEDVLHLGNSRGSFDSFHPPLPLHVVARILYLVSALLPIVLAAVVSMDSPLVCLEFHIQQVGDLELVVLQPRRGTLCRKAVQGLCFQVSSSVLCWSRGSKMASSIKEPCCRLPSQSSLVRTSSRR